MNRNSKKGFTIVELIIVIAVIAVLAAVLIPTFSNLIQKANVAADQTLIKNLNTALAMDTDVSKHETMTQALEATKANGFDVEKIVARATDNKIVWDSANDCFAYIEKGKSEPTYIPDTKANPNVADYQLWTIVNNTTLDATYSSYIAGTSVTGAVEATKGVDVGENTGITAVTYKNETTTAQTVTIRTNGGTLEVNAKLDTVYHFNKADKVVITAVALKSYHENGEVVGNIEVADGRVVMESGSKAAAIKVVAEADDITNGNATIAIDTKESNTAVVLPEDVKSAIENKKGDNLLNVKQDNLITDEDILDTMDNFAGGLGTEESPYLIANVKQFSLAYEGHLKLVADIDASSKVVTATENTVLDLNGHEIKSCNRISGSSITVTGSLTLKDSVGGGCIYSETKYAGKYGMVIISVEGGEFTMESGTIKAIASDNPTDDGNFAIGFGGRKEGSKIVINGGRIEAGWYAVAGNGSAGYCVNTELVVNGGELISVADYAIYNPQIGNVTINGGTVMGYAGAISMNRGTLTIKGGTLTSKGTGYTGTWGDGTSGSINAAISLTAKYGDVSLNYVAGKLEAEANAKLVVLNEKNTLTLNDLFYNLVKDNIDFSGYNVTNASGLYTITKA